MFGKLGILISILVLVLLFYFVISLGAGAFSKDKVNIDAKKNINFGDKKGELIVKGETLHKLLKELIDAVKQSLTPAACVAGPYPVTLTNPAFLEKVKAKLSKMLSDRVTTI